MLDFHSHILPGVDDGSKSVEESIELLRMLKTQGITTVCATPHFLADKDSVDEFLLRRDTAFLELKAQMPDDFPEVLLGAEVAYYVGLSKLSGLQKLCLGSTNLLLIEMPMDKWAGHWINEIEALAGMGGYTLVLAHVERYYDQNREAVRRLVNSSVLLQVNASFFDGFISKAKAFSLLKKEGIHFIGSDCHSVKNRPPRINLAYDAIRRKMGEEFLKDYIEYQQSYLQ